ncbi:MAG TPA: beta-ketoacyl synthase N-terminal-like domain-containing protein, partial [Kofleriaceae bacterium]|nr:beta-ketoacyl synthase N-terminal-like domain-containing protein [Kofleriaceae bacterium]
RLQHATGVALPATVAFDHPSPEQLAAHLHERLRPPPASSPGLVAEAPRSSASADHEPLAIVGIGLRLPGGVADLAELWRLLAEGRDAIRLVPPDRWSLDAFYVPDRDAREGSYVREAGFLDGVDRFDAGFFGISPREALHVDPQHRLVLEAAWHALEDARIVPATLAASRGGVFIGIGPTEYEARRRGHHGGDEAYAVTGMHASFAAGRLAYTLGLRGPTLAVDTACSSSLVALHLGCQALRRGECDLALVGGVQVLAAPEAFTLMCRTRALAPDGRSKTFSGRADGYGRGEGVVVLAVERLSDARAHGRRILALVRGSAINHDGASSGITVPNGSAQQQVLRAALEDARLIATDVDVVECHGTGTSLGDPIEVNALAAVYGHGRPSERPLLLGAVKPNLGHLESAAGLAGVAKVIACLARAAVPPTLHTTPRNPHVEWDRLPVRVADELGPWPIRPEGGPRRAGVSAFGLSGTNAHVILEQAPEEAAAGAGAEAAGGPWVFAVSGKTAEAMRAQAARLRAHVGREPAAGLGDVAFSLATTRTAFAQRA